MMTIANLTRCACVAAGMLFAGTADAQDSRFAKPNMLELDLTSDADRIQVGFDREINALVVAGASGSSATVDYPANLRLPPILADVQVMQFFVIAPGIKSQFTLPRWIQDYYVQFVALDLLDNRLSGSKVATVRAAGTEDSDQQRPADDASITR